VVSEEREVAVVDLLISVQSSGEIREAVLVEFHGHRSSDLCVDEAKYWVDDAAVAGLQSSLIPSLPRPICFLDALLALPLAADGEGRVPFRLHILEDMLCHECWAEESDQELVEGLALCGVTGKDDPELVGEPKGEQEGENWEERVGQCAQGRGPTRRRKRLHR